MQNEQQQVPSWGQVAGSEKFQALAPEQQERARELYFQDAVLPRVPQGMEQRAREMFDQDTMRPAQIASTEAGATVEQERPGVMGTLWQGTKSMGRAISSTADTYTGNRQGVVDNAAAQKTAPKAQKLEDFYQSIESDRQEGDGLGAALKNVGGSVASHPGGAGLAMLEQFPNAIPTLGGGYAGMKLGAAAGAAMGAPFAGIGAAPGAVIGGIVGGLSGMFLGNTAIETGHKAMEMANDGEFTPEEERKAITEGAIKGGVLTVVDGITLGAGRLISSGMQKTVTHAMDSATRKVLIDSGIDVSSKTAIAGAVADPVIASAVRDAQLNAVKITDTLRKRAVEGGTLLTIETAGEGVGEYVGELAATGEADVTDAVLESLMSFGQSSIETGWNMQGARHGKDLLMVPEANNDQEDATFENTPEPESLEAPGLQGLLPAPEQTFYADSQGNVQDTGPIKNVDGVMQPSAQGSQWVNPANRVDAMTGGPGMDQQTPLGEPAPLTGQFQHGAGQQPVQQQSQPGLMLEGELQRQALPAPDAIVVDGEGNAQRGATAPQVFDGTQSGGRGMDQQAPTAKRNNDQYETITKNNGQPYQTANAAKASKAFRDAKKAGRNPTAKQVDGGFVIQAGKDPKRSQMRPESSEEFYANQGQTEAAAPEPAKAAQTAKPKTPEQQAEYSWGTMNTFERNKAVVDSLGYDAGQADSIAGLAWSELNAADKQTLSDGMANAPAQRWDAPNQKISDRDRPVLQNRDRSTDSSIAQMQGIKSNPDYNRLSVSRDFGNGAPVIEPGAEFPGAQLGRKEKTSTSTGRGIEVQYAAVEADQLLASNDALGNTIPEYESGVTGKSRAIAGNGRVAGVTAAWKSGNAESYKQQMIEDTGHGIDPETIKGMKQPVLVRIMPLEDVSNNIGDESNVSGQAGLSAIEQASTDMRRLDLTSLELTADNELSEATVMGFIKGMPTSELGTLLTKSGRPTQAAYNRAETALFQQAYQSEALTENLVDLKGDAKFIMNALMRAAPAMAKLDGAGMYDIRPLVSEAAAIAVNARRAGIPLREYIKTDQIDNNPIVTPILEMMVESGNKTTAIGDKLISLAQLAYAEANKSGQDMFGEVQKLSPGELMRTAFDGEQINDQENTGTPESLGDEGRPKPDDKPIERQPNVRAGQPDSGAVQAEEQGNEKRAAKPEQAEAVTEKWRKNYLLAAKKARELGLDPKQHGKLPGLVKAIDAATAEQDAGPALELEQQTEESRAEAERTEKARLEEEKKTEAKQARAETKTKESANDKQAVESSMDRFELGQSAEQQLSGQEDIFGSSDDDQYWGDNDSSGPLFSFPGSNKKPSSKTTNNTLLKALNDNYESLVTPVITMLQKGRKGLKGGLVIIEGSSAEAIAKAYSDATGMPYSQAKKLFSDAGSINGFYDADSGLTFLVGPNLTADEAVAVLLHEVVHSQQRKGIDDRSMRLIGGRNKEKNKDLKAFLNRVAARMDDAGETGNPIESTSYIVEQALLEGRSQGYTAASSKLLTAIENTLGKTVAGIVRDFVKMVRQFALRNNFPLRITIDDLVQYAMAGIEQSAKGKSTNTNSNAQPRSITASGKSEFESTAKAYGGKDAHQKAVDAGTTKLNYNQWVQVRTPAFKEWFGDWENAENLADDRATAKATERQRVPGMASKSAKTDTRAAGEAGRAWGLDQETGEPRLFFHGTKDSFTEFNLDHQNRKDHGWLGTGVYTGSERRIAESYARLKDGPGEPRVMAFFSNVKNPYIATREEKEIGRFMDRAFADNVTKKAKAAGYDGIVLPFNDGNVELVAFDKPQVKSATDNNGNFSRDQNDIRFSRAQTRTPAFKKWFSDSQVLTKSGDPLVVYRGMDADATVMSPNDKGIIWVTPDKQYASDPHYGGKDGGAVYPMYAKSEKLFDHNDKDHRDALLTEGKSPMFRSAAMSGNFRAIADEQVIAALKRLGFDGFKAVEPEGQQSIGLFESTQIKSAIGNNGSFDSSNPDIRFSRAQTNTPAFKKQFGNTKVVDEKGNAKVVYHGTAFSIDSFSKDRLGENTGAESAGLGFFFTDDTRTAESYANYAATTVKVERLVKQADVAGDKGDWDGYDDLISQAEELESLYDDPKNRLQGQNIVPVFLAINNPMTFDAKGENAEGFDISAAIKKAKRGKHDGVIITNLDDAVGLYDREATHYIAFEPGQAKSAVGNDGSFDGTNPDIRYSKTSKSEPQNLYVAHNLSADNLRYASKLGGLAAPSIAIGNIDTGAFSSFGEITLLAEPNMLESSKVRTFDADIYTPRHPRSEYQLDLKAYKTLSDRASKLPGELRFPSTSEIAENGANAFIYSDGAKMLYLEEQGKAPKTKPRKADAWIKKSAKMGLRKFQLAADPAFKKIAQAEVNRIYAALEEADPVVAERRARFYFDEGTKTISTGRLESMAGEVQTYAESSGVDEAQLRKDISAKLRTKKAEADFKAWANAQLESMATSKKIYTGLTAAGNRKYIDYNLANIVKQMTRQLQGGEGFNYGAGSVRSAYANEMKTVESVKNRRDQIVSAEEFAKLKDESNKKLTDALEQLKPYYRYGAEDFGYNSDASSAIAEGPSGIREAFDLDDKGRKIVADLVGYLRSMPTEYFEAKAGRAVDLSEFSYAVVPKGTPSDVLTILRENGIKVKRYDADNPASREEAIRSTNKILFSKKPGAKNSTDQDTSVIDLPEETRFRKTQRIWQDKLNRFTVLREWLEDRDVNLDEDANVYLAEERMHSKFSNKATDFREKTVKPLVEKIQKAGHTMEEVAQYLHAQHAQERNAQIAKINKQMPDGGSGMTNAEARSILAAASKELGDLAQEVRAITDSTRKVLLDSGLISKDQANAWQKAYKNYVPLKGGPDEKAAQGGTGKGLKASHKSKRALGHQVREEGEWIVENILADHERALLTAEKNEVGKHLLKMAMDVGIDEIMTVGKPEKRGVLFDQTSYEVLYKGRPIGAFNSFEGARVFKKSAPLTIGKNAQASDVTIRKTSDPSVVYMASPVPAPNEAMVYVDGDIIRVQINDDRLAQAYGSMGDDALGTLLRAGQSLNRWLSNVYTGYAPEFLITNVARDFTTGLANITGEEGASFAAKSVKNYFTSFGELLTYARTGKASKWVTMYREDGGNTGAAYLSDLERMGADMQTEYAIYQGVIANLKKGEVKLAARAAMRKAFNATLRHLEALNEAGENSMRLALYRTAIEQGMTRNKAASMAKNTTVNFNRRGEMGAQANALYLFFNATVQGTASVAHAHFKGKHKKQAMALSGSMAALGYSLAMLSAGMDEDDYEKTPEHAKERNLVVPLGNGEAMTIPVPYGYGFFFSFGRLMADAQREGNIDNTAWKLASAFVGEFMPFGGITDSDEPDLLQTGLFMLPTLAQIPMSVAVNRTSFGGPMRPDNPFKQYEPDRLKMWRGTEGTWADELAGALESVGADVSPETLKYLNRTFTGGSGNFVTSAVDAALLGAQGATPEVKEIPLLRKFYRQNSVSDARARFWRYQGETRKATEGFQRAMDKEDGPGARKFAQENRDLLAMGEVASAFSEVASASRDRVQQVRLGDLPVAKKREQIKKIEDTEAELYDRFVKRFKERVK